MDSFPQRLDKRLPTYSGCFVVIVTNLEIDYVGEIAVDYLFEIHFVMFEMKDIPRLRRMLHFLLALLVSAISFMHY